MTSLRADMSGSLTRIAAIVLLLASAGLLISALASKGPLEGPGLNISATRQP